MICTSLHQIEITSRCNLACAYCLHRVMTRPKMDMTRETWADAMRWLRHFVAQGTQGELVLSGTGEPTLHQDLPALAMQARHILGPNRRLMTTTNGLDVTPELAEALRPSGIRVYVSLHKPERAEAAVYALEQAGLFESAVMDPVLGANSWAGQVHWPDRINAGGDQRPPCPWLSRGWMFVSSTGWIYDCCYANGDSPTRGHISEPVHGIEAKPWAICGACWQRPPAYQEATPALIR